MYRSDILEALKLEYSLFNVNPENGCLFGDIGAERVTQECSGHYWNVLEDIVDVACEIENCGPRVLKVGSLYCLVALVLQFIEI